MPAMIEKLQAAREAQRVDWGIRARGCFGRGAWDANPLQAAPPSLAKLYLQYKVLCKCTPEKLII